MNLVTVNDASNAFGDRQLTVDVIADNLLLYPIKTSPREISPCRGGRTGDVMTFSVR